MCSGRHSNLEKTPEAGSGRDQTRQTRWTPSTSSPPAVGSPDTVTIKPAHLQIPLVCSILDTCYQIRWAEFKDVKLWRITITGLTRYYIEPTLGPWPDRKLSGHLDCSKSLSTKVHRNSYPLHSFYTLKTKKLHHTSTTMSIRTCNVYSVIPHSPYIHTVELRTFLVILDYLA